MRLTTPPFVAALFAAVWLPPTAAAQRLADLPQAVGGVQVVPTHAGLAMLSWDPTRAQAQTSSRGDHILRGALWGALIYAVLAGTYVVHEAATCDGPECFGEGTAWIGLVGGLPLAVGAGAAVGAAWPNGS